ncbi:tandem-95 repeat protein [Shewanella sp. 202IG2-18]|uniref:cadherin-like domain-containing protein n=1 Tax=Parashewanella hymeniacidonis TaxID=2807618 RepID=UPI0019615960|nr:cadherin-like domain-containing protein [Parashewanella hymeniacidonis]MBM7072644.1 tandem-95 repeat protein [Parashewanella hymeniacidonis]
MFTRHNYKHLSATIGSILLLSACGGGSSDKDDATKPTPPPSGNTAPTLIVSQFTVDEDDMLTSKINFSDADGDSVTLTVVSQPENGTLSVSNNGNFDYLPKQNFNGSDTFTVKASDGTDESAAVAFNIEVNPVNDAPTVSVEQFSIDEDEDKALTSTINFTDVDSDSVTIELVSETQNGELTLSADGMFSYSPNINFNGNDSFSVKASDGDAQSSVTVFNIEIAPVNDAPTIDDIEPLSSKNTVIEFTIPATDVDGDALSYSTSAEPKYGTLSISEAGIATYTPIEGAAGEESFQITASDNHESASTTVTIENNLAYEGQVNVDDLADVQVFLTSPSLLLQTTPASDGSFKFYTASEQAFAVKAQKAGYQAAPAKFIDPNAQQANSASFSAQTESNDDNVFELTKIEGDTFTYHWAEDQSTAGTEYSANVNQAIAIEFLDEEITPIDQAAADKLRHDYNVVLVDSESGTWSQEHAYRILETMKSIPQIQRNSYKTQTLKASKWQLTQDFLQDDIRISESNGFKSVTISIAAFVNATPKVALADGRRGVFYSQRLHHALVRYVTNNGQDKTAVEKILNDRFGISSKISSYPTLTQNTTNEGAGRFQQFHSDEIVRIINMFEEMPKGMHKLADLKYLARRLNGTPHPLYPTAAAVAWPSETYIEFMETAFTASTVAHVHRLIIHEKAHFLWANHFDQALKDDWIELGGWYFENNEWFTTKQTEFVSAYSHSENPNEDMAETVAYFIVNPDKLRSRSLAKYEFVRDRIMQGSFYLSQIRDDLTFQVYNLFPDYVFPGKINQIDISVEGAADEDKTVTVELKLHALDNQLEGAKHAYTRIFSETGTYVDLYLYPTNGQNLGTTLKGSFTLSKRAKNGFWRPDQIVISDEVGNERYAGANDFGWKLFVNNSLEDIIPPQYIANTASLSKVTTTREGNEVQIITAEWEVDENAEMANNGACYASMNDQIPDTYRVEEHGAYNASTATCTIQFIMPHYMPSSTYSMNYIKMKDKALNTQGVYFTHPGHGLRDSDVVTDEQPQSIELTTNNPDLESPELDLTNIQVTAAPINPAAPNGETEVTITFKVRDNISGYNIASLQLRDPQGVEHHEWAYNEGTWALFPTSDPTQWKTYTRTIILPAGSAPGTWGVSEMTIYDRAGNFQRNDFTEIVHFDVLDD